MHKTDQGNFPMISKEKAELAKKLAEFVPGDPECSIFGVTRGESFEFACKLARGYTKRQELISVDGSWFGQTGFTYSSGAGRPGRYHERCRLQGVFRPGKRP